LGERYAVIGKDIGWERNMLFYIGKKECLSRLGERYAVINPLIKKRISPFILGKNNALIIGEKCCLLLGKNYASIIGERLGKNNAFIIGGKYCYIGKEYLPLNLE